jgi:hypothetical protein
MVRLTVGISPENLANVYTDKYIESKVKQDHRDHYPVFHELAVYLSAWVDDKFVGAYLAIRRSSIEFEVHSFLLRDAVKYSRELGDLFLAWLFDHAEILRVTAPIIQNLEAAKNYAMKFGFKIEGLQRNAVVHRGKPANVYMLGLLREEWETEK